MKRTIGLLLTAVICGTAVSGALAQSDPGQEKKAIDSSIKLSGVIYTEYAYFTGLQPGSAWAEQPIRAFTDEGISSDRNSTFRVNRVYINLRKDFSENLSMRVTTDVESSGTPSLYLKFAYFQYRDTFWDFLGVNLQGGLISTPVTGFIDGISDCRWIYNDLIDKSANLLNGAAFDYTADYGFSLGLSFTDLVTVTGAVTNGEGYKKNASGLTDFDGMAYYGTVTVRPISQLYLSGFFRMEEYQAKAAGTYGSQVSDKSYYGFGAVWKSDLIRAGAHYWFLWNNDRSGTLRMQKRYRLLEAYLMMNLGALVPTFPLLIHGRYGNGIEMASRIGNSDTRRMTHMIAGGLGWAFSPSLRMLAYYERYIYEIGRVDSGYRDPKPASNFMVKCEVAF
jgi:hypothetical protein